MKKYIFVFMLLLTTGCFSTLTRPNQADRTEDCLTFDIEMPDSTCFIDITIEGISGDVSAYTIDLHYDPAIVKIEKILPASKGQYRTNAILQSQAISPGNTRLLSFQVGEDEPKRKIHAGRVFFKPIGKGTTKVSASIRNLYNSKSKSVQGIVHLSRNKITVK